MDYDMIPEKYCFEGETIIKCSKCGLTHNLSFSGMNPSSIEEAIEDAMEAEGWGVATMMCPDCYDPIEEQRALDAMIEEESVFDEYDDFYESNADYEEEDI